MVGFFDSFDDTNCVRLACQKLLHPSNNCGGRGTVTTARVGGDNQNFWNAIVGHVGKGFGLRSLVFGLWSLVFGFWFLDFRSGI
jgi:hypothetical protein